jgi:hypothetical protein
MTQMLAAPPTRRVIDLEDADSWTTYALNKLREDDVPAAVYGVNEAIRHATQARDELISLLLPAIKG